MVRDTYTTVHSPDTLIEMFLDGSAGEVYNQGRLSTIERENDVALVAYGEHILATIDGYHVTFYTGHYGEQSDTVTRYVSRIGRLLNDTTERTVAIHANETPQMGIGSRVSSAAQYIDNFVGHLRRTNFTPVEQDARAEVNRALLRRMSQLFD